MIPKSNQLIFVPGGIVNGQGLESSSHKYGLFQNTCVSFELVLCDASLTECSKVRVLMSGLCRHIIVDTALIQYNYVFVL